MFVIAITGSLGTGKSTVAKMFGRKGAVILSADKMAHELLQRKGKHFREIVKLLGRDVVSNGNLDRSKIAAVVFNSQAKRKQLEKIIHPTLEQEVKKEIKKLKSKKGVLVLDVPLLFEAGWDRYADWTITVAAPLNVQLKRVSRRPLNRQQALNRIKSQMPLKKKIQSADIIIDNGKTLKQTQKQVNTIWQKLLLKIKK